MQLLKKAALLVERQLPPNTVPTIFYYRCAMWWSAVVRGSSAVVRLVVPPTEVLDYLAVGRSNKKAPCRIQPPQTSGHKFHIAYGTTSYSYTELLCSKSMWFVFMKVEERDRTVGA